MEQSYPLLSKPFIVGYMSVNVTREYRADLSELKYVTHIPKGRISFDLDHNAHMAIKRSSEDNVEKIDLLLKFLLDQRHHIQTNPHFIMYRRTMINVFCSALGIERSCIVASLFNGSIYLCTLVGPENDKNTFTEPQLRFCAWGYKFEQYMNADSPSLQPDVNKPVVENAEFSLYFRAKLGNHELLYGAQIDGMLATDGTVSDPPVKADYETNLSYLRSNNYVELKTNKLINHWRQEQNFKKFKLLKTWAQCYLANLKGLIIGYRNDEGIVERLQYMDTDEILKYCQNVWTPGPALQFLDYFLTFVKKTFRSHVREKFGSNCDFKGIGPITLQFDIDSDRTIRVTNKCEPILPEWFVNDIKKNKEENK